MQVLYDISVLGLGFADNRSRTGIFRVVENIAEQLMLREDVEITFACSTDKVMRYHTFDYLQTNSKLSSSALSVPLLFNRSYKNEKKIRELVDKVYNSTSEPQVRKIAQKVQIRSLLLEQQVYNLLNKDLIHPKDLKQADIFHATYYPIPEQVQQAKDKSIFVTAYDLIPVLAPQYTPAELTVFFKKFLGTLTPETWILCISADCRNDLLNYMGDKVNPERVRVTELAASGKFYPSRNKAFNKTIRQKYNVPDGPYLLSLCTLEPRKNIDSVVRAFAKLVAQENVPDLNLVLVGGKGWMFDKIFEEIEASAALKNRIIITGFVPDEDLAPIYSDALLFVYPSLYEGFGLPPLEAMQCGTPVITSNVSSLPEVVGDAGIMVDPKDLEALCQAMLSVYKSASFRDELVEKSLQRAKKFSWERCASETVAAYKTSLNS